MFFICEHIPSGCRLLEAGYVYKIVDNGTMTQDFWVVDFDGVHHHLVTIPAATEYYEDDTYTYDITFPSYTYEVYEVRYSYGRDLGTDDYSASNGVIESMGISGSEPSRVTTITREYGPDLSSPPSISVGSATLTEEEAADVVIPKYFHGDGGGGITARPPISTFQDEPIGDGDNFLNWDEIWNSGTVETLVGEDGSSGLTAIPWVLVPEDIPSNSASLSDPTNPDGTRNLIDTDGDGVNDRVIGSVWAALRYVVYSGSLQVSTPTGQSKRSPTSEFSEVEVYASHAAGKIQVVIRDSGRPGNRLPGQAGQADGAYFPNVYTFEVEGGAVSTPTALAHWLSYANSGASLSEFSDTIPTDTDDKIAITHILKNRTPDSVSRDWLVSTTQPRILSSNDEYIWGYEFWIDSVGVKNNLLSGTDEIFSAYEITPIHVVLDPNGGKETVLGGGDGFDDSILPRGSGVSSSRLQVPITPFENQESFDEQTFSLEQIVFSWTENSINVCHSTAQIITPEVGGS